MSAIVSTDTPRPRRGLATSWLLIGGYVAAVLDLLAAVTYWARLGVAPIRIPQSIAAWLLGPAAYAGGTLTAVFGTLFYGQLLWGVALLYHLAARRHPLLHRRPFACGALYGMAAYVAIFQLLVPRVLGVRSVIDPIWTATCLLVYALLVGIPCALFSRIARVATQPQ